MAALPLRTAAALAVAVAILAAPALDAVGPIVRVPLATGELQAGVRSTPAGSALALRLVRTDGSAAELPEPGPRAAARVDEPTPVVAAGELAGLLWLEGATRESYGLRYSPWTGVGWGAAEEVAAPGPGSQLALAVLPFADGRILAVWAGFDGEDDEILWALRGAQGGWSAPARIAADNAVPDITPALAAAPGPEGGALVAWSRYDGGQYRIAVARFDGERFRVAKSIGGPGTTEPGFVSPGANGEPRLLFRQARPRGWGIAQLDRAGAVVQEWFAESAAPERPGDVRVRDGRLQFLFGDAATALPRR